MKTSARNRFGGIIQDVQTLNGVCEVTVQCGDTTIISQISPQAQARLQPKVGSGAVVMVKAPFIILMTEIEPLRLSAENVLHGTVVRLEKGEVNQTVMLELFDGLTVTATITLHSSENLDIHIGQKMAAVFNAANTILGVM
ncbi:TOBE domain-containing protein [Kingella negevensis]|uniref:TOBE domain-containing protein n=1 Tax=Kingella negevensis TaxID=1522312 RepID=UPI00255132A8|nr:TOBE domain-containing protein [Kingella negevensis]MDK4679964.1 TOBE domain-containing protein [Kingella negevensis]MDK4682317.1 TOBE domain-containing protein [Kingella negevensis]MDK4690514.1 TOBE domain-containing protein [Kingella negevensis]MDK4692138.1 TOBE domain-containing protein [Kingella negevensis]MDK4698442.1 TOBE domain-containing protein [Kingella negevensis]